MHTDGYSFDHEIDIRRCVLTEIVQTSTKTITGKSTIQVSPLHPASDHFCSPIVETLRCVKREGGIERVEGRDGSVHHVMQQELLRFINFNKEESIEQGTMS